MPVSGTATMRLSWLGLLLLASVVSLSASTSSTSSPTPCWSEAFPNQTARSSSSNPVTCGICTEIFQGLDDFLLDNEDQVTPFYRLG